MGSLTRTMPWTRLMPANKRQRMPTSAPKRLRRKSAISKRRCNNWSRTLTLLKNKALSDEARMESLENQLKDARILAEEADKKYDDIAKKLQMVESDLDRAEERADTGETKIIELEEELRVVGNNLKS